MVLCETLASLVLHYLFDKDVYRYDLIYGS